MATLSSITKEPSTDTGCEKSGSPFTIRYACQLTVLKSASESTFSAYSSESTTDCPARYDFPRRYSSNSRILADVNVPSVMES